jgi:ABC-type transport system involved in multi-copper enzyme maturation permease subunit
VRTALAVEWLKLRRSTIARVATVLAGVGTPAIAVGIVALARSGLLQGPSRDKFAIALVGTVSDAHLAVETQILAVVMMLGGGLLAAWLYGRELVEGTLGSLFALPVSRREIAAAKAILAAGWSVAAAGLGTALTLLASAVVSPATMDAGVLRQAAIVFGAGTLMGLLGLPFGLVAIATRGYLGAFTALLVVTAASQILASIGWGYWVPYVAPALWAGAGGADAAAAVRPEHLALALCFAVVGALATVASFRRVRIS